jgi:hypothetical protein
MKATACMAASALAFVVGTGGAAPPSDSSRSSAIDPAESTMKLIADPKAEAPDAVTATIESPPAADTTLPRVVASPRGPAQERGASSPALEEAAARERGREWAAAMDEAARENRENLARRASKPETHPATVSLEGSAPPFGNGPVSTIAAATD